jgi:hypothetical protein
LSDSDCLANELVNTWWAYNTLHNKKVDAMDETNGNVHKNPLMSANLIEKIVKQYKTHQSAADFDSGFVDKVVDAMKGW